MICHFGAVFNCRFSTERNFFLFESRKLNPHKFLGWNGNVKAHCSSATIKKPFEEAFVLHVQEEIIQKLKNSMSENFNQNKVQLNWTTYKVLSAPMQLHRIVSVNEWFALQILVSLVLFIPFASSLFANLQMKNFLITTSIEFKENKYRVEWKNLGDRWDRLDSFIYLSVCLICQFVLLPSWYTSPVYNILNHCAAQLALYFF